ncbi:hypothetical protein MAPG_01055 [Magnaporthiopsis poae ATCC 64411]|uniref:Uncharacterized protein n=1 Tax=Magnaporthiopsis poae (strain ATCC 64411 / 73-15) TaxID=644358 RepID=A0A0C4DMP4_MAGP6|nr:hypothetical protein MAPG_01055 [Magnaporthiopsis poae ATCC 64411]
MLGLGFGGGGALRAVAADLPVCTPSTRTPRSDPIDLKGMGICPCGRRPCPDSPRLGQQTLLQLASQLTAGTSCEFAGGAWSEARAHRLDGNRPVLADPGGLLPSKNKTTADGGSRVRCQVGERTQCRGVRSRRRGDRVERSTTDHLATIKPIIIWYCRRGLDEHSARWPALQ